MARGAARGRGILVMAGQSAAGPETLPAGVLYGTDPLVHPEAGELKPHANALHLATGLDMAEWWQPTRRSFLGRVSKDQIVGAVRDACGIQIADTLVREKRDWMIDRAERKLAGKGWLPALLRAPVTTDSIPAEEEPLSAAA